MAAPYEIKKDTVIKILQLNNDSIRQRKLVSYIFYYFHDTQLDSLNNGRNDLNKLLDKYNVSDKAAFEYFIKSNYESRILKLTDAENSMLKAIQVAVKHRDHYLLYAFFSNLAFIQISDGNSIGAISSYRFAKKETVIMNDPYLQALIDVNISDLYYRNNFYNLALVYLNEAQSLSNILPPGNLSVRNVIYSNKCDNFFKLNKQDSLQQYNKKLKESKTPSRNLYTYINRTNYYLYLLKRDYNDAIKLIVAMQQNHLYSFDDIDRQALADAYYKSGQPDFAKVVINQLLTEPLQNNHPEIKFHLYDLLGEIAEDQKDYKSATANYKLALIQTADNLNRLKQVSIVASQIKTDEIEVPYILKTKIYKRERIWLIFTIITALLTIAVIAMFYNNVKQKRRYEGLLYKAKKDELAFLNSHDVRKHLTNILGIIDILRHSENKEEDYAQAEGHLFYAAESLDKAIKNISEKLDNYDYGPKAKSQKMQNRKDRNGKSPRL